MQRFTDQLFAVIAKLTPMAIFDILVVSVFIYIFIINIRGRRAAQIVSGMFILTCAYLGSVAFHYNQRADVMLGEISDRHQDFFGSLTTLESAPKGEDAGAADAGQYAPDL